MSGTARPAPRLTIGLGTWNRSHSVTKVIRHLSALPSTVSAEFLVVDDASDDETSVLLERLVADLSPRLRVIRHPTRRGFGGCLVTLISEADGEWLLLTSDDDVVLIESLPDLIAELDLGRAAVLVPGFIDGPRGDIRSGPPGRPVHAGKIWGALGHAPGIVIHRRTALSAAAELESLLRAANPFAIVYPQVVVGIGIAAGGGTVAYWPRPTAATGDDNPSGIRDPRGEPYWAMSSRMRQFFAFQGHLQHRIAETTGAEQATYSLVLDWNRRKLLDFFNAWLTVEHPEEAAAVRESRTPRVGRWERPRACLRVLRSGRL